MVGIWECTNRQTATVCARTNPKFRVSKRVHIWNAPSLAVFHFPNNSKIPPRVTNQNRIITQQVFTNYFKINDVKTLLKKYVQHEQ